LETCYLGAGEFSALTGAILSRSSLFSILERDFGVKLAYADEEIDISEADAKLASLLQVHKSAPLMRIRQIIYSTPRLLDLWIFPGTERKAQHSKHSPPWPSPSPFVRSRCRAVVGRSQES
jgi:hypothetical protein